MKRKTGSEPTFDSASPDTAPESPTGPGNTSETDLLAHEAVLVTPDGRACYYPPGYTAEPEWIPAESWKQTEDQPGRRLEAEDLAHEAWIAVATRCAPDATPEERREVAAKAVRRSKRTERELNRGLRNIDAVPAAAMPEREEATPERAALLKAVDEAIAAETAPNRELYEAVYGRGIPLGEWAEETGQKPNTVAQRHGRMLRRIGARLRHLMPLSRSKHSAGQRRPPRRR